MKIAFLDRDGTLVYEPQLIKHVTAADVRILPGVIEGLKALKDKGFALIIVSNQAAAPGFARRTRDFWASQKIFEAQLAAHGIRFDYVFLCAHVPFDDCPCRKPKTGMVDEYLRTHPIDTSHSMMIGDRDTDGGFAKNLGIRFLKMETNGAFPSTF